MLLLLLSLDFLFCINIFIKMKQVCSNKRQEKMIFSLRIAYNTFVNL